ncbi:hypothetical protein Glove_209g112 [Diversispora epigaea]|uniref:Uncharacterized protein n=1 Tax=Diversispora epigaea TaxID=1348612 RepID=A0A397IRM0_9GLOM|nr:hypothetical protein Glove_209g112 [Diversispora epigaea]
MSDIYVDEEIASNWLDLLSYHPIFKTDQLTDKLLALNLEESPYRKQSLMALIDNKHLIVAIGSELRMLDLADFKNAWSKAHSEDELALSDLFNDGVIPEWINNVKYIVLDTPSIKFKIRSITFNFEDIGSLIAVTGDYEVAVVVITRPRYETKNGKCPWFIMLVNFIMLLVLVQ